MGEEKDLSKVLYILQKDKNMDYDLSTHGDIEKMSFIPWEKEVLFFPFSSFEIQEINKLEKDKKIIYEIKLLYLGKYLPELKNDENLINKAKNLPDSEFKRQIYLIMKLKIK